MQTTTPTTAAQADELTPLRESWERHLDADGKSPRTIVSYCAAVDQFVSFLKSKGMPTKLAGITREHVESFIIHLRDLNSATTAATRYSGLQQFFKWLIDDGEIAADQNPMRNMNPPKLPEVLVPIIPNDALAILFASCKGNTFIDRRDNAIMSVLLDGGPRLSETSEMLLNEDDLRRRGIPVIGKRSKQRAIPIGPKTVKSLDRYIRVRKNHKDADLPWLWLGPKGRLTKSGIYQMLSRRCKEAGIEHVNPHRFRHTFSHLWLVSGGTEHALAAINGWNSTQMVGRYAKSAQAERAHIAHRALSPREKF